MAPAVPWRVRAGPEKRCSTGPISPSKDRSRTSSSLPQPPKPYELHPLTHIAYRVAELLRLAGNCCHGRQMSLYWTSRRWEQRSGQSRHEIRPNILVNYPCLPLETDI